MCDKDTLAILVTVTVCVTNDSRVLLRIISVLLVTLGDSAVLVAVDCRMQRKKTRCWLGLMVLEMALSNDEYGK